MADTFCNITCKEYPGRTVMKLSGRVDSSNSEAFGKELISLRESHPQGDLELNLSDLEYVSSSGLRVLLKMQKAEKNKIHLTDVGDVVYNVLDSTGFTRLFEVFRTVREFDMTGCEEMARGTTGVVYRVDDETILKLYTPGSPVEFAQAEQRKARTALVSGVPTAIPYEIVKSGDSYGVLFEMVKANTASSIINTCDEKDVPSWGRKLGALMKDIHSCHADTRELPALKDIYIRRAQALSEYLTPSQIDLLVEALRSVPDRDTMLHGDFHVKNIMLQDGEFLLIDMIDIGYGHPIFDLSMTYISSRLEPQNSPMIIGLSPERSIKVWDNMLMEYFGTEDMKEIDKKMEYIKAFACARIMLFPIFIPEQTKQWKQGWIDMGLSMLPKFIEIAPRVDEIFG